MALKTDAVGKKWSSDPFTVEGERIAKYADAVGEGSPIYRDAEAAKAEGFRGQVAPPMFCVVYGMLGLAPAVIDPELEMNFARLVHGSQEFIWGEPVCAGDLISTEVECTSITERNGNGFYVFEQVSTNQDGAETVRGTWTNIVRGV